MNPGSNQNKKHRVNFNEVEHGIINKPVPTGQPISIISRDMSVLGFTLQLPIDNKYLSTPVSLPEIWPTVWTLAQTQSLTYSKQSAVPVFGNISRRIS